MLGRGALKALAVWCAARGMRWTPARTDDGAPALLLERRGQPTADTMLVIINDDGFRLVDANGELLASASDLPSLLDALDGGVAEPPRRRMERPTVVPVAVTPLPKLMPSHA
jgi:hypothetical protein